MDNDIVTRYCIRQQIHQQDHKTINLINVDSLDFLYYFYYIIN